MKVEVVLGKCGGLSRYQVILLFLFCMINVLSAWHYYSQTIISFVPDHWCFEDDQGNPGEFLSSMRGEKSSCEAQLGANTSCDHYIYDLYMGYESLASELNWVCQSSWKVTVGHAIFFVGSVFGTFTFGIFADVIGRIPILIAANLVAMTGNLLTVFTNSWYSFCLFRFISGLATDSNFVMMYILVVEYIDISFRTVGISLCIGIFYCIGSATAPWIAIATKSWKTFLLVTSIPFGFVPMVYFIVPESIQWLVAKQKFELAANSLKKIAKLNHQSFEATDINTFIQECRTKAEKEQKSKQNLCGLFKTPRLRRNTLILFFKSMVITLCYDAVSRNVQGKGVSPFVLFSLSAVTIFPACILLIILQDKIGRKAMSALSLLFSGLFISASGFILSSQRFSENNVTLLVILSLAGRFGVTVAYNSAAQYATELIPTCVRCQGVAMVHVIGYGFTFFSSYILHSQVIFNAMPELILGTMSFIGSFLCLFLPETTNRSLPNTLEEGEDFGKDENFLTFYCFKGDR